MTGNHGLREIPEGARSVYDGRNHVGWIAQRRDGAYEAILHDRMPIGVYATVLEARSALRVGEA